MCMQYACVYDVFVFYIFLYYLYLALRFAYGIIYHLFVYCVYYFVFNICVLLIPRPQGFLKTAKYL